MTIAIFWSCGVDHACGSEHSCNVVNFCLRLELSLRFSASWCEEVLHCRRLLVPGCRKVQYCRRLLVPGCRKVQYCRQLLAPGGSGTGGVQDGRSPLVSVDFWAPPWLPNGLETASKPLRNHSETASARALVKRPILKKLTISLRRNDQVEELAWTPR